MNLQDNIRIAYMNIDGIHKRVDGQRVCKTEDPHFQTQLFKYDIICLVETHCGDTDHLTLPGYHVYQNNRAKSPNSTRSYGGIAVYIKSNIRGGIKLLPVTCSEIMWIKLQKEFFHLQQGIFLAVAYVLASSSFSSRRDDIFEILENDIAYYTRIGSCFLCGDFNGKTGLEPDYCIDEDSHVTELLNDSYIHDIPMVRRNTDTHEIDNHGSRLLSLCKTTGLRILNGRILGDYHGHYTCFSHSGKPSVIDYMLSTIDLFPKVEFIYVHEPNDSSIQGG